ncbi:helix-turn-helix domain-containing protein [Kitasatospora viridis]|uniref:AraC-like DNA-binding protein n=1 Tax=Kitasatospora viridis TaxID=281105 RepID=A0A561UI94_9ACTN|nr:AraC family transcriptional regulator [Kitasatospora viridis]TWF99060.1 AraC-like DNA-binding protein [Kitasatospora viridis]
MLSSVPVASRPAFEISAVTCRAHHARWSAPEARDDHRVVLVRRGGFRRSAAGVAADLDRTLGYLAGPGEEESFAHPAGGDLCTAVTVTPELWRSLAGDTPVPAARTLPVDPRLDLAHRRLLLAGRSGDVDFALAEELVGLLTTAVTRTVAGPVPAGGGSALRDRRLVAAAREAIVADHPAAGTLLSLAELLGVSPYRLSRAFPRELGVSVTGYRHRVRIATALDRLEGGEPSLAALAAELGYADQAHFTRTLHRHLGHTPSAVRRLLRRTVSGGRAASA